MKYFKWYEVCKMGRNRWPLYTEVAYLCICCLQGAYIEGGETAIAAAIDVWCKENW